MAVDPIIKQKADDIRHKIYGKEVRESLASGIEAISEDVEATISRQDYVEEQFQNVIDETTDKDVISAPELIAARNGKSNLKTRLDDEHAQVTAQLAQIVTNVTEFGAIADSDYYDEVNKKYYSDEAMTTPATDNTPSFQAAVDYLSSIGGGTIFVPKGNYVFRSTVKWKTKVSIVGTGVSNTIFFTEGGHIDLFSYLPTPSDGSGGNDPDIWLEDCRFEDFQCDLIGLTDEGENIHGKALFMLYMRRARFHNLLLKNTIGTALGCDFLTETVISNVTVYNAGRNWKKEGYPVYSVGQSGIGIGTCALEEETVTVSNCFAYNCGNYGIFVETQLRDTNRSKGAKIINCHVSGNNHGIGNKGSGATQISGCTIKANKTHGIYLSEPSSGDVITNNIIEDNLKDGIRIDNGYLGDVVIEGNQIKKNNGYGICSITASETRINTLINNNQISDNGINGVHIEGNQENVDIKGNNINNNGRVSGGRGIRAYRNVQNISIQNNTLFDDKETKTQIVGVQIDNGVTGYFITGNNVIGYTHSNAFQLYSTSGVLMSNSGEPKTETTGVVTFSEGETSKTIPHGLSGTPKFALVTANKNFTVWVSALGVTNIIINRQSSVDDITVYWNAKL